MPAAAAVLLLTHAASVDPSSWVFSLVPVLRKKSERQRGAGVAWEEEATLLLW